MITICILYGLIKNFSSFKFKILILLVVFKGIESICDIFHGIFQKNQRLDIAGKSLFFRSIINIIVFTLVDYITKNVAFSIVSMIITNILILLFFDLKLGLKYKCKDKNVNYKIVFKLFKYGFYTFGFSFIANYIINAPRYALDSLMSSDYQTIFGIIIMPGTIIMLINQFLLQPVIVKLKDLYSRKNKSEFLKIVNKLILAIMFIGILSIIAMYFIGIRLLNIIYNLNLNIYLKDLIIVMFGALVYTISIIISNSLIVMRKTKFQFYIYLFVAFFSYLVSYKLIEVYGFDGSVYAYFASMLILLIAYMVYYAIVNKRKGVWNE